MKASYGIAHESRSIRLSTLSVTELQGPSHPFVHRRVGSRPIGLDPSVTSIRFPRNFFGR